MLASLCLGGKIPTANINNYASFCTALGSLCCLYCTFESIISSHRVLWEMEGVRTGRLASLGTELSSFASLGVKPCKVGGVLPEVGTQVTLGEDI